MNQRKLYRTIESLTPENYVNEIELFTKVIEEIIDYEDIHITGARIWQLDSVSLSYRLVKQMGKIERIEEGFRLSVNEYPLFHDIADHRSVMGIETHDRLLAVGIKHYAATGIGEKVNLNGSVFYPYIIAFNSDKMDEELLDTLNIISSAVTTFLKQRRFEKERRAIELELEHARQIQKSIIPQHEYKFGSYEIYGTMIAERHVCGDFFDYIEVGEDNKQLGIVVGDAAGKGLSAAVQALYISGALRLAASHQIKNSASIKTINKMITRTFPDERFATLFYSELFDNKSGLCVYVNAGHNSPIFYNSQQNKTYFLESTGGVLGLSPEQNYIAESINFKKGDLLVCYSDGITDAANVDSELFGEERLEEIIIKHRDKAPKQIVQEIINEVQIFSAQGKYPDDKTVVVIKRVT